MQEQTNWKGKGYEMMQEEMTDFREAVEDEEN